MKKFFLRRPFFRLLTPLVVGSVAYVLILLLNNDVAQLQTTFMGAELYFSIGLSLLVQETILQCLRPLLRMRLQAQLGWRVGGFSLLALLLSIFLVGLAVRLYYVKVLGYQPASSELLMFCGIFGLLASLQISLYVSHQLLLIDNEEQVREEQQLKEGIIADFHQFKRGINPDLLLESLEVLIVYLYQNKDLADEVLDHLAAVYRYVLGARKRELVPLQEELRVLAELIALLGHLPYRKINWQITSTVAGHVVPGTLLALVESIIRTSIVTPEQALPITLRQAEEGYYLRYPCLERIQQSLNTAQIQSIIDRYAIFSEQAVSLQETGGFKTIFLPAIALN